MFTVRSVHSRIILSCLLVIGLLVSIASPQAVRASTLTVDTLLDENDGSCSDGDCALRDAIQVATAGDTITFSVTGTLVLTLGELIVDKDLTLAGPGVENLAVSGNDTSRVFNMIGGVVSISGMTISHGYSVGGSGLNNSSSSLTLTNISFLYNYSYGIGGGMYSSKTYITLTNVTFSNNSSDHGGGLYSYGYGSRPKLTNVVFTNNSALFSGGGLQTESAEPVLTNVTFSGNSSPYGGGICLGSNNATVNNVTLTGNTASVSGGGIYSVSPSTFYVKNTILAGNTAPAGPNCAGSITSYGYNLIQDTSGCTVSGDETGNIYGEDPLLGPLQDNGGATLTRALLPGSPVVNAADDTDPDGNPVTQDQRGVTRPQGPANDMGAVEMAYHIVDTLGDGNPGSCSDGDCSLREAIDVAIAGDIIIFSVNGTIALWGPLHVNKDLTISGPGPENLTVSGQGYGQVFRLETESIDISGLTIADSFANYGAGIYNSCVNLTLTDMIFRNNSVNLGGGGLYNEASGSRRTGESFNNNLTNKGRGMNNGAHNVTLIDVTFSNNLAGEGGGMYSSGSNLTLTNVTFSGNSADMGGGIYLYNSDQTLTNVTLAENSASVIGGGLYNDPDSTSIIKNTIIAGNTAPNGPDCAGVVSSYGYNLIQDTAGCTITGDETGNIYGEDPLLGPLQDNGGVTFTHALLHGSPAINAADDTDPYGNPVTQDQRGVSRPQGPANDIGAYEAEAMHVQAVNLHLNGTRLVAMVAVYDQAGLPVKNASVTGTVKGPNATHSFSYTTNFKGIARFSGPAKSGIWKLCVTDIVKDGYMYDPSQNVKTCAMIKIP